MPFTKREIEQCISAFNTFNRVQKRSDAQAIIEYLFDVLHRTPEEQAAERRLWLETEAREIAREAGDEDIEAQITLRRKAYLDRGAEVSKLLKKLAPEA